MDDLRLSIFTPQYIKVSNIENKKIICYKNSSKEMLLNIKHTDKVLYCKENDRNSNQLFCYRLENKANLNLDKNDWFSFTCNLDFTSERDSTPLLVKTILNQFYFLEIFRTDVYNNTDEYQLWGEFLKLRKQMIAKKDFYVTPKNLTYCGNGTVTIDSDKQIQVRNRFNAYYEEDIDKKLSLDMWDSEYINQSTPFGEVIEEENGKIKFLLNDQFDKQYQGKPLILRLSLAGDYIAVDRLEKALDNASTHTFSKYILSNKKIETINSDKYKKDLVFQNKDLNSSQQKAVKKALASDELFMIQGPPGTGKTTVIAEIIYQEIKNNKKVLLSSQMNKAVNIPLDKIKKIDSSIKIKQLTKRDDNKELYDDKNPALYGVTLSGCGKTEIQKELFDILIIDEVSKATPLELVIPILLSKKVILVGDHKQLPPQINSKSIEEILLELDISDSHEKYTESVFEKLINNNPQHMVMLDTQYRMHPMISQTIMQFYDGKLKDGITAKERYHNLNTNSKKWKDSPDNKEREDNSSYYNPSEINTIMQTIENLNKSYKNIKFNDEKPTLGIISFYGKQTKRLFDKMQFKKYSNLNFNAKDDINNVDGFQGEERDIMIISLVRSNNKHDIGFSASPNRINVALSRAKRLLIIIGNKKTFRKNRYWKEVLNICEGKNG
jgi:superfamily I DNA and/or RNA helicase